MDTKHELKTFVHKHLGETASDIFIKRALTKIDDSADDRKSLLEAAEGVSRMVALFIDESLASEVLKDLTTLIGVREE